MKKQVKYGNILKHFFVATKFVGTVFVVFIVLSHVITESSIIIPSYSAFLQLYVIES